MSIEVMTAVLHHSRATGTAKLILLGIANHAGDGGAWPTIATLARYANVTERAVQQQVAHLVKMGELQVHLQMGGTSNLPPSQRPNRYDVLVQCPLECDRSAAHRIRHLTLVDYGVKETTPGEACFTPPGEDAYTPGVKQASPKTSYNHPLNSGVAVGSSGTDRAREAVCSICGQTETECLRRQHVSGHTFEARSAR